MGRAEPRLATCSNNLGNYYSFLYGNPRGQAFVQAYPQLKGYFGLGATCINEELESQEDILTHGELSVLFPVEMKNFNEAPRIYAANLSEATETIAGRNVTCFSYGDLGDLGHKNCFDSDGVLVSSERGGSARMQLNELVRAVSDSDFVPPYAVVASPEQCPGNTAWDRATPTNPGATVEEPIPGAYHDALTKFFNVRSKVTYEMCSQGGDLPVFVGPLTWTKDGTTRARFDLTYGRDPKTSYFVSRSDQTVCTEDASKYLHNHAGGNQLKQPFNQSLLKLSEACFPDSEDLGGNGGYEYESYVLDRIFVVPNALKIDMADWEHTDPLFNGKTYHRTVAGLTATCFTQLFDREECYTEDGVLVFARNGVRDSLVATSVSTEVSDVDFALPYELKQATP